MIPAFVIHQSSNVEREPIVAELERQIPGLQRVEATMVPGDPVTGCSISHQQIIAFATQAGYPGVWILEDDCVLTSQFDLGDWLQTIDDAFKAHYDVVVGGSANGQGPSRALLPHLVDVQAFSSCHCWVAFHYAYDVISRLTMSTPIDVAISQAKLKKAVRVPFIGLQAPSHSSIELAYKDYMPWFVQSEQRLMPFVE